jgi:uncharacterized membrane protein HdeD (DUF308 family)
VLRLLLISGALDIISSAAARDVNSTWWLGLVGILEILPGFCACQQMFPARAASRSSPALVCTADPSGPRLH